MYNVQERLHVISAGVPIFKRNDRQSGECKYRLNSSGLAFTKTEISDRVIPFALSDVANFLSYSLFTPSTAESKKGKIFSPGVPMDKLTDACRQAAKTGHHGSNLLKLNDADQKRFFDHFQTEFAVVVWNARHSISPLTHENDLKMLQEQLAMVGLIERTDQSEEIESHFVAMNERRIVHENERKERKKSDGKVEAS